MLGYNQNFKTMKNKESNFNQKEINHSELTEIEGGILILPTRFSGMLIFILSLLTPESII